MQKELSVRKKIRLRGYDYSEAGFYFVTMCVKDKHEMMGSIVGTTAFGRLAHTELTPLGVCVDETIQVANKEGVKIDKYVIMPNHVHMIIVLTTEGKTTDDRGRSSLQQVVKNIKSYVTKWAGFSIWQPRFYDHIIRNEVDYQRIWQYIDENPARWVEDDYYIVQNQQPFHKNILERKHT
ncbi:MAG: hypothetical protein FWD03_03995 [Defluviitaleaceae bacterium]|nr:hypothetical protein [Defluviitaleaceae bacterium]